MVLYRIATPSYAENSVTRPDAPQVNLIYLIRLAAAVSKNNIIMFSVFFTETYKKYFL